MLLDRLVCGVRDEALQRRLLAETALDFKKAYEKAVAAEYATRHTAAIRGAFPAASDLHRMDQAPEGHKRGGKQDSGKQSITGWCSRCNGDHDASSLEVLVKFNGREGKLPLLVTKGCGISILRSDWFQPLGISLEGLHQLNGAPVSNSSRGEDQPARRGQSKVVTSVKTVLQDYSEVFKPGLGKSTGPPVRIEVEEQATPKFQKPRQVPFALLPKVEEAIEQGIYVPVKHSRWATPILQKNGKMRICGDYNPVIKWETLPTPEQLLARLGGMCSVFSA
ncbi:hypothetical protein MTO96_048156 [Rhipicephalus appendiculatus]